MKTRSVPLLDDCQESGFAGEQIAVETLTVDSNPGDPPHAMNGLPDPTEGKALLLKDPKNRAPRFLIRVPRATPLVPAL